MEDPSIVGGLERDDDSNQSDPFYWVVEVEIDLLTWGSFGIQCLYTTRSQVSVFIEAYLQTHHAPAMREHLLP